MSRNFSLFEYCGDVRVRTRHINAFSANPPLRPASTDRSTFFVAAGGNQPEAVWFHDLFRTIERADVMALSGRIQGPPGNDPGLAGGFVLSSGHEEKKPDRKRAAAAVQSKDRDMGSALRSIYQKTIEEAVPDEMLSLLGKLD